MKTNDQITRRIRSCRFRDIVIVSLILFGASVDSASGQTAAKRLDTRFPRLGMWWPDPETQPLKDIARYDYVMLFNNQEQFVKPIKAINRKIILLNSTNACEVSYQWDQKEISKYPTEWFLTQVGSTIADNVNATTTTFRVAKLSVTDGTETFELFVPGDTALIEGESVRITSVDRTRRTLTVERGLARPASVHSKGTRIAAHVTFWPGSWLMNLSHMSPAATFDKSVGSERWGDYHARQDAKLVANSGWDGLTIDRADPNQSWLVGGSTARTIDPDQSNQLVTDYSKFDASWNKGLRAYETRLRKAVGDDKIIYVNWGMENYDLLNGNNYEGFPLADGSSYRGDWRQTVIGPISGIGGYFEWMKQARHPNLTTVQTYEDDGSPPPDDISYNNSFEKPNFVPNYRKMRFGLGTALLGDGFFSYEINTNGHGSLGLMWFDEYDNAGAGRGYLGKPQAAAFRVAGIQLGKDLVTGGDFNSQQELDRWQLSTEDDYEARLSRATNVGTTALPGSSARIDVTRANGTAWKASFSFAPITLSKGTLYTLRFRAKADGNRSMAVWSQQNSEPWDDYFDVPGVSLNQNWQDFEVTVTSGGTSRNAAFYFGLGKATGTVWIDNVTLRSGGRDVWRRDYSGGTVIVNATSQSRAVDLGETFRKIKGNQVPDINDGTLVDKITLPARDALILLRPHSSGK